MAESDLNSVMDRLLLLVRSGYPVIYLVTHEESRVLDFLTKIVRVIINENPEKKLLRWYDGIGMEVLRNLPTLDLVDLAQGTEYDWLSLKGLPAEPEWESGGAMTQPVEYVLDSLWVQDAQGNPDLKDCLVVFYDLHPYLKGDASYSQVRRLRNAAEAMRRYYDAHRGDETGEQFYRTVVVVAPNTMGLSMELEGDVLIQDFPLPETDELRQTIIQMLPQAQAEAIRAEVDKRTAATAHARVRESLSELYSVQGKLALDPKIETENEALRLCDLIAGAGRGLTLEGFERGLNMFRVQSGCIEKIHIEKMLYLKAQTISNQALQYTPSVEIDLGGLDAVKQWIRLRQDAVASETLRAEYHLPPPKGVLLYGVSGGGKSQLAKLIAKEFNLALLRLDVGALFGSYVGESEERTRQALRMAEVLAPVVLWIDEADKAFSGVSGSGGDSGVSARVFGHFLTWLSEKSDSVFVVLTANDINKLLVPFPEFGRKGRFDQIFWVDLPTASAREQIFGIYLNKHLEMLTIDDGQIDQVARQRNIRLPADPDPFKRLLKLLSHDNLSQNMTGAEIEYAVSDALFDHYSRVSQGKEETRGITVALLIEAVDRGKRSALYGPNAPESLVLNTMRAEARTKGWPSVD